jgi:hypothetical protein
VCYKSREVYKVDKTVIPNSQIEYFSTLYSQKLSEEERVLCLVSGFEMAFYDQAAFSVLRIL